MAVKIGELAKLADCQVVTIRYYEKEGLLQKPVRTEGGYRLYREADVERLKFIRHCREHGMSLAEIKILLGLRDAPDRDCSAVGSLVDKHIEEVDQQIKSLEKLKSQLVRLRGKCPNSGVISTCGIIKGLADRTECGCLNDAAAPDQSSGFPSEEH